VIGNGGCDDFAFTFVWRGIGAKNDGNLAITGNLKLNRFY